MRSPQWPVTTAPHLQAIITELIVPALLERLLAERVIEPGKLADQPICVESQPTA